MKCRSIFFLVISLVLPLIFGASAYADTTISKKQIELISDFTLDNKANAGGTITQNYYVFPDTKGLHGGPGTIKVVDRNTCKTTSKVKIGSVYLSGLYNKWGTNYITLIGMGKQKGCYKLNGSKLQKASSCPTPPSRSLIYQGTGQGNTATMNNYVFKVAGFMGGRIGVWNSSGSRVATYKISNKVVKAEPENISIDGKTGEVYINYAKKINGKRHSLWYKIDSSVFSKYTGKKGTSNPVKCKNSSPSTNPSSNSNPNSTNSTSNTRSSSDNPTSNPDDPTSAHTPVQSNYDGTVETNFFGTVKEDGTGCGVFTIVNLIVEVLTYGVAILSVIAITVAGIIYLTAKDNVEQTVKAKRRISEIVIGLAAYAALYAVLNFLLPGGHFNTDKTCSNTADTSVVQQKPS